MLEKNAIPDRNGACDVLQSSSSPEATSAVTLHRAGRLRWRLRPALLPDSLEPLLKDPDVLMRDPSRYLPVGDPLLITMAVVPVREGEGTALVLRRLNYGRMRHRLRDIFRPARPERAFKHGLAMEAAGLPTPRVVAAGVERVWRWPVRSYLITEFVPNAVTLGGLLKRQGRLSDAQVRQLADMVARLHASGFSHRDLKSGNILYNERLEPCFIDLDGVRQYRRLNWDELVLNLSRLAGGVMNHDPADHAKRFLKRYCRQRGMRADFRRLYAAVTRRLERSRRART